MLPRIASNVTIAIHLLLIHQSVTFTFIQKIRRRSCTLNALSGGGREDPPDKGPPDNPKGPLDEWLSDANGDSDDSRNTRKQRADSRLPLNFRSDAGSRDEEFLLEEDVANDADDPSEPSEPSPPGSSSALERIQSRSSSLTNVDNMSDNPYSEVISRLTPSEMILRFTSTAHPRVQDAVKTTILGLIGNLPRSAFETTVVTTGERLASLMFQLEMTGYMFKNVEYRMALSRPLSDTGNQMLLESAEDDDAEDGEEEKGVKGKMKVKYDNPAIEMEVDAAAYLSELRSEVKKLKEDLAKTREAKEESVRADLLTYIRTLPPQDLQKLTGTMSEDVLNCMKGLVSNVMKGIGGEEGQGITPDTVMEQSGEAMAQLCMWQLVIGYNLRELEVREEMTKAFKKEE